MVRLLTLDRRAAPYWVRLKSRRAYGSLRGASWFGRYSGWAYPADL